ncbi:MAG: SH3 domain-containing protein [Gammaproteobacteria bacterium]|nr:SH3 domain-containing protein [Gammaproteobacteria bacterium]
MARAKTRLHFIILSLLGAAFLSAVSLPANAQSLRISTPQNINALINPKAKNTRVISVLSQAIDSKHYIKQLFVPWGKSGGITYGMFSNQKLNILHLERSQLSFLSGSPGWNQYGKRNGKAWVQSIAKNMLLVDYSNTDQLGIAVQNTYLRQLPTMGPRLNTRSSGQRYHFDTLQISSVWIGTPVHILQISQDQQWALIKTVWMIGWVPYNAIAVVDSDFITEYQTGHYAAVVDNQSTITPSNSDDAFTAYIGSVLPYDKTTSDGYDILVPEMGSNHQAIIDHADVSSTIVNQFPIAATPGNFARIIQQMMGEPYDWGGLHHNSDCSGMMMKIFTPFGIWLPRSSIAQASTGQYVPLRRKTVLQRQKYLLKHGVPFMTLVYINGHIMLYVGKYHGQPIIFHNLWGLALPHRGFAFAGKAVLTPVNVGASQRADTIVQRSTFGISNLGN